jgi:polyphosphate:AMP phosphotransferase
MLEQIDLSRKVTKKEYKAEIEELEIRLAFLQREAKRLGVPVIIVFEGWDAAGKGTLINNLILPLDPRGFSVYSTLPPNEEEALRPFLWRFWIRTPARGRTALFDRSWYRKVLIDRTEQGFSEAELGNAFRDIRAFERQLVNDGNVIIKFFLHISKDEQKKRFKKLQKNPATAWRVTKEDLKRHKKYDAYLSATEQMIAETETDTAPWTVIEATDRRFATLKIFNRVIAALEYRIEKAGSIVTSSPDSGESAGSAQFQQIPEELHTSVLDKADLSLALDRDEYKEALDKKQDRIRELEHELYMRRIPVVIVYEGWDAAGKGGNIKRLTRNLDPRGYQVVPVAAPNDIEKAHHYLWRFWMDMPKAGHIAIFDRSWYGRVMVERVEGFCTVEEWRRAYREINEMEQHITNFGTILIKFWVHIDKEEQLRRFQEREKQDHKKWKITEEDWRNREKWDLYKNAVEEMLFRTSTPYAPWTIVESNCKWYARIKALDTVISAIEARISKS